MLKVFSLILILAKVSTHAMLWNASDSEFINKIKKRNISINKYGVEAHDKYDFKSCKKHISKDDGHYQVRCENQKLTYHTEFTDLSFNMGSISKQTLVEEALRELKKNTISSIRAKQKQVTKLLDCLKLTPALSHSSKCERAKTSMLRTIRQQLPMLRRSMALMEENKQVRRNQRGLIFTTNIKHPTLKTKVPKLQESEIEVLNEHASAIKHSLEQNWFQKEFPKNRCVKRTSPITYTFKKNSDGTIHQCAKVQAATKYRQTKKQMKELRSSYENQYKNIIKNNPILGKLNLSGQEEDSLILKELTRALKTTHGSLANSLKRTKDLKAVERLGLIHNTSVANDLLKQNSSPRLMCDIFQYLKDEADFHEIKTDLYIVGATLAGGGLCAFSAGLACVAGVAIIAEGANLYIAQDRLDQKNEAFSSGLISLDQLDQAKDDRDLALILAPLAVVGEGLGQGIRIARKSVDLDYIGRFKKDQFRNKVRDDISKIRTKKDFISKYEEFVLTSPRLNSRWIEAAKKDNSAFFLDVENASLKRLNDTIGDKAMVTSLTNLHKDILSGKINELLERFPDVDIEVYSDFKSLRYSFSPKSMSQKVKNELIEQLQETYKQANNEFSKQIKKVLPELNERPDSWFQAGIAQSADQAGITTKKARLRPSKNTIVRFEEIEPLISMDIEKISKISKQTLEKETIKKHLSQLVPGTNKRVLNLKAIEIIRKLPSPSSREVSQLSKKYNGKLSSKDLEQELKSKELINQLKLKLGINVEKQDAIDILDYTKRLDGLTPGLWLKERVNANLNEATFGGMSGDITAMGARNIQRVGLDIANMKTNSAKEALSATRLGEELVTKQFDKIKDNFTTTVKKVLSQRGLKSVTPCSGDDCIMIPTKELSYSDKAALVREFANQENPSQYRLSFIPKGIEKEHRTNLAVHGELIEKKLRSLVGGVGLERISLDKLNQITIATDMPKTGTSNKVNLIIAVGQADLSDSEMKLLTNALQKATKKVNHELEADELGSIRPYSAGKIDKIL